VHENERMMNTGVCLANMIPHAENGSALLPPNALPNAFVMSVPRPTRAFNGATHTECPLYHRRARRLAALDASVACSDDGPTMSTGCWHCNIATVNTLRCAKSRNEHLDKQITWCYGCVNRLFCKGKRLPNRRTPKPKRVGARAFHLLVARDVACPKEPRYAR
jgi:hypothetical protein